MTDLELKASRAAFAIARKACRDHVASFAKKGEYGDKVAKAFIRSINVAQRKHEKAATA